MTTIDRERALITARSILANIEVLESEGLDDARQTVIVELAERLAAGVDPGSIDDTKVVELVRRMRETLMGIHGEVAATYVTWLEELLHPEV